MACPNCPKEIREQKCFSDGLYCLMPPKQSELDKLTFNVTDTDLLLETLWGRCVFETYKERDAASLHYFNYLYDLMFTCLGQYEGLTWSCMNDVVNWIGADVFEVVECINYSWSEALNN